MGLCISPDPEILSRWRGSPASRILVRHGDHKDCANLRYLRKIMPTLKTHKGAAKRFKKTGTGKYLRGQSKMRHILTSKEKKTKRKLGGQVLVSDADAPKVRRMIPYA